MLLFLRSKLKSVIKKENRFCFILEKTRKIQYINSRNVFKWKRVPVRIYSQYSPISAFTISCNLIFVFYFKCQTSSTWMLEVCHPMLSRKHKTCTYGFHFLLCGEAGNRGMGISVTFFFFFVKKNNFLPAGVFSLVETRKQQP